MVASLDERGIPTDPAVLGINQFSLLKDGGQSIEVSVYISYGNQAFLGQVYLESLKGARELPMQPAA